MNFEDLLSEHSVPIRKVGEHEHAREGWLQFDCPFCASPGHFRMGYNNRFNYCNCWNCGSRSVAEVVHHLTGLPFAEIKKFLKGIIPKREKQYKRTGTYKPPTGTGDFAPIHLRYLKSRGFSPRRVSETWQVQGIGLAPRLKWRLFIPVLFRGEPVSWTTRSCTDKHSHRYINAKPEEEAISIKRLLYGWDAIRNAVILVEGPMDVWRIGPGAAGTFGLNYTPDQIELVSRVPTRVICFDSEHAAQVRAKRLAKDLSAFPGDTYNVKLDAEDPGSASKEEILELRQTFLENAR